MRFKETNRIELKERFTSDLKKEIVAFANTEGGTIYIGVADDGTIVGLESPQEELERISNAICNGIKPDLSAYTNVGITCEYGCPIIEVTVHRGEKRPYHLSDKGFKPNGVYIRHGVISIPASEDNIREMIRQSDGFTFDKVRSLHQELTFEYATQYFAKRKVNFFRSEQTNLGDDR